MPVYQVDLEFSKCGRVNNIVIGRLDFMLNSRTDFKLSCVPNFRRDYTLDHT